MALNALDLFWTP